MKVRHDENGAWVKRLTTTGLTHLSFQRYH